MRARTPPAPRSLLPHRGRGDDRPVDLARLPLLHAGRPLKRWRYALVVCERLMLCAGTVRIGPVPQRFWAVWDRERGVLRERTRTFGATAVVVRGDRLALDDADADGRSVGAHLTLEPGAVEPVETTSPDGAAWTWTRKRAGVPARGSVLLGDERVEVEGVACVDDSAGFHARTTTWRWSTGAGALSDGRPVAWNLVTGVHDDPAASECTVWLGGAAQAVAPVAFAPDLSAVGGLRFALEAERARHDRLGPFESEYRQPFGTFSGRLPGGLELAHGLGVVEAHRARW